MIYKCICSRCGGLVERRLQPMQLFSLRQALGPRVKDLPSAASPISRNLRDVARCEGRRRFIRGVVARAFGRGSGLALGSPVEPGFLAVVCLNAWDGQSVHSGSFGE